MIEEKASEIHAINQENLSKEKLASAVKNVQKSRINSEYRPTIRKLTLFSALPQQALLSQLESGFIAEPNDKEKIQMLWQNASNAYNRGSPSRSFITQDDIKQLIDVEQSQIDSILSQVRNYAPYDSHPTSIYNVRISKLITPQLTINLMRAKKRVNIKQGMNPQDLFEIVFKPAGKPEPIIRQILGVGPNGGSLLFTSYDEDIRLHHPPQYRKIPINEKDTNSPTFESMCLPVGGGLPFAVAYRIQLAPNISRLILGNGIHRIHSLAEAGYEWCPLLVCDLIPLEISDPFVELPRSIILDPNSNPPLITDFLNNNVVIPLDYFTILKTIRLNWNFEQYVTVLR